MRPLWAALAGVGVAAGLLAAGSGAVRESPSGDTCTATGSGTAYTLNIGIPANAPQQGGFAFGAPGATVANINIAGSPGTLSTQSLPANTTGEWLLSSPAMPGSAIVASLMTSAAVTGSFTVVPASSPASTFYDAVACTLSPGTAVPSAAFTVEKPFVYAPGRGAWHASVSVANAGRLIFAQISKHSQSSPKPVIKSGVASAKGAGKVQLTLVPTAAGKAALQANGSLKLNLTITFSPKGGRPLSKVLSLTLRK